MSFELLVRKRMFLLVVLILMVTIYFDGFSLSYNRTLGWAYDRSIWIHFGIPVSYLIYIIVYGLIAIFKIATHKVFSFIHLLFLLMLFILNEIMGSLPQIILPLLLASVVIFILNVVWSLRYGKKI